MVDSNPQYFLKIEGTADCHGLSCRVVRAFAFLNSEKLDLKRYSIPSLTSLTALIKTAIFALFGKYF